MNNTRRALVILSGGQDSTTCLFWAKQNYPEVHAISFDYGQRHIGELRAACKVAEMAGVESHDICHLPAGVLRGTSPLTDPRQELEQYENPRQMEETVGDRREATFVPMRNALFLTIAANRAEVLGGADIVIGVSEEDNANYDDCRSVFLDHAMKYIAHALGHDHRDGDKILIAAPLLYQSKAETVEMAMNLPGCWKALAFTHTSYSGEYPPTDKNHANILRADGFEKAGLPDPLVLRAVEEGLMKMPATDNYLPDALARATALELAVNEAK